MKQRKIPSSITAGTQSSRERGVAGMNKVLMLVENVPAPADRRVWPEALTLRDQGYQVSIISPKGTSAYRESYICIENIHIYRYDIPVVGHKYLAYIVEYAVALLMTFWLSLKVWRRHGFDVIHAANPPDLFFLIGLFYRPFGKKYVFDQHDLAPELFQVKFARSVKLLHRLLLFFEKCSYRTAHLVVTSNLSQKQFAIQRGHRLPDRIFVVRNGPNLEQIRLVTPEPDLKRGFAYLLAYVGLMDVQDGVEYCVYALHELVHKRGRRDVSLVLIGQGSRLPSLKVLAHELELDEYINFTGLLPTADVVRYLTVADIGLIPDPRNGVNEYCTMIKTMEYMALGKPIVAFDLQETRFSAGGGALYATPNLVEDYASKIETLLDDEQLRRQLGNTGYERVVESLSWHETRKNLILAYEMLEGFQEQLDIGSNNTNGKNLVDRPLRQRVSLSKK